MKKVKPKAKTVAASPQTSLVVQQPLSENKPAETAVKRIYTKNDFFADSSSVIYIFGVNTLGLVLNYLLGTIILVVLAEEIRDYPIIKTAVDYWRISGALFTLINSFVQSSVELYQGISKQIRSLTGK